MNQKLRKINTEYHKNATRIAELQARQNELEKQRTALENTEIIGLVRSVGMTPEQLAALIKGLPPVAADSAEKEDAAYAES